MKKFTILALLTGTSMAVAGVAQAQVITQWNFNSTTPDATTTTGTASPSVGTGILTAIGGTTSSFAAGSPSDPANTGTDNSGYSLTGFPAQATGNGTAGAVFAVSTAGSPGAIQISLDFRQSGTASRYFQLQLSTDGTTFVNASGGTAAVANANPAGTTQNTATSFDNTGLYSNNAGGGSQAYVGGISYLLPSGSAYANDANFAFRFVAAFDPNGATDGNGNNYISANAGTAVAYVTTGNVRFDDVTVSQVVPEPSTDAMLGLAVLGLVLVGYRRAAARM